MKAVLAGVTLLVLTGCSEKSAVQQVPPVSKSSVVTSTIASDQELNVGGEWVSSLKTKLYLQETNGIIGGVITFSGTNIGPHEIHGLRSGNLVELFLPSIMPLYPMIENGLSQTGIVSASMR